MVLAFSTGSQEVLAPDLDQPMHYNVHVKFVRKESMAAFTIEPVQGRRKILKALRFLVGGAGSDALFDAQAKALAQQTILRNPQMTDLWWACTWRKPLASAMVCYSPGRTGLLLASPVDALGVDRPAMVDLLGALSLHAIGRGSAMVQSLINEDAHAQAQALTEAGFKPLAKLISMRLELDPHESRDQWDEDEISWQTACQCTESDLTELILKTYKDSLDCPALDGVREINDIIAGHKASGVYRPQSWWIALLDGKRAGCLLMNDSPEPGLADVVYLGVAREFRGRGLGRAMLLHALGDARTRGLTAVALAVAAGNHYARRLYDSLGFEPVVHRWSYFISASMAMAKRAK
jgi:ribosomal protein S18 acetylase RimI-like enzyme